MSHCQTKTLEDAGRSSTAWNSDIFDHQPRFPELMMAMLPASLILATATALLVALI